MNRDEKAAAVEKTAADIEASDAIFAINYRGISVTQAAELRGRLSESDSSFTVVKNRLTKLAAAKAGVVALSRTLAKETARSGITVNSILPGYIETDALADMDEDARKQAKLAVPMRRFGKPEEVAAAVYFLASTDAAYITGAALKIDGGIF